MTTQPISPALKPETAALFRPPSASADARFFLTSDLEAVIGQLPGVRGVRIIAPEADIEEVHVMASKDVRPKTLVRNIVTLLLVRFSVRIDHRCVSIVQSDEQPDHQLARPVIYDISQSREGNAQRVKVELRCSGQRVFGMSQTDEQRTELHAGSLALIEAVENLIGRRGELDLREAKLITLSEHDLILVLVSWRGALAEELFVGAAFASGDRAAAAARATLDAINRKLVRLPVVLMS